jgi:hypothetical protein
VGGGPREGLSGGKEIIFIPVEGSGGVQVITQVVVREGLEQHVHVQAAVVLHQLRGHVRVLLPLQRCTLDAIQEWAPGRVLQVRKPPSTGKSIHCSLLHSRLLSGGVYDMNLQLPCPPKDASEAKNVRSG